MSLVPVLITVALLAGLVLAVRLAGERAARLAAEARVADLNTRIAELEAQSRKHAPAPFQDGPQQPAGDSEPHREWLAVLAHELRSPVGAILGYSELLDDGTIGRMDSRSSETVGRIANAAEQILRLVEGIEDSARDDDDAALPREVPTARLLAYAADVMRLEAEMRNATITVEGSDAVLRSCGDAADRGLLLALGAAIKASAGRNIRVSARTEGNGRTIIAVSGTGLGVEADDPERAPAPMTGAGLRITLARRILTPIGGSLSLHAAPDGTDLLLTFPATGPAVPVILAAAEQDP